MTYSRRVAPSIAAWNAGAIGRCFSPGLFSEDLHLHPRPVGLDREVAIQLLGGLRQRPALEVPGQQEDGLQLAHDRAFEAKHDVVEPLVVVVVLDPRSADERHAPVHDDDLAVVEMAEVIEPPVDLALAEQAVEVEEATLVGHDLHATLANLAVQRA